jgi:PAS domain-containing protein
MNSNQPATSESPPSAPEMTAVFAAALRATGSEKEHLERLNRWLEVALNNMARGLSMFDAQQRLILCNQVYRDIYNLPEEAHAPGNAPGRHRALPRQARNRAGRS